MVIIADDNKYNKEMYEDKKRAGFHVSINDCEYTYRNSKLGGIKEWEM